MVITLCQLNESPQTWRLHCQIDTSLLYGDNFSAHSSSSKRAFKSPTRTHLNLSALKKNKCFRYEEHVDVDIWRISLKSPSNVPLITGQKRDLKWLLRLRTQRTFCSVTTIHQHTDVKMCLNTQSAFLYSARHLKPLYPTVLSFYPPHFGGLAKFMPVHSANCSQHSFVSIFTFALQVYTPRCLPPFCLHVCRNVLND
jgi:hypothetical protein